MSQFSSVEQARSETGVRLVLTANAPGPWGEAVKGMLYVKDIPYIRVRQQPGGRNEALVAWTGVRNAPQIIAEDEKPIDKWRAMIDFAEARAPEPRLVPSDPDQRARMFALIEALAGEGGFAWNRRLLLFKPMMDLCEKNEAASPGFEPIVRMAGEYGYSKEAAERASKSAAAVIRQIAEQLSSQREAGKQYLIGDRLSALDIHWAAFAALVSPLPDELCPMPDALRQSYATVDETLAAAVVPEILEHRDFVYREHLELPVIID